MVAGRPPHQGAAGVRPWAGQGVGLRRPAGRGRQDAHLHLPLAKLRGLHKAAGEDRARYPERAHLPGRRQPQDSRQRPGEGMVGGASQDRACFHPEKGGVAEPHRGLVAAVQATGFGRARLRRQLRDRSSNEGRHPAAEPEGQSVGVGTPSPTTEASEARFCLPSLRNGALGAVLDPELLVCIIIV